MDLEPKHSGKDLIVVVNLWNPGTKATSTFLNECAASSDYLWSPPEQGMGKWKKYSDLHLFEFGLQCVFKAMSLTRETSKLIIKELRKATEYQKSRSKKELEQKLEGYMLIIKNSKFFKSVWTFKDVEKSIKGEKNLRQTLEADGPASHVLILVPEVVLKGLVP